MSEYKFGVIGLGRMGTAILESVLANKLLKPSEVLAFDVNEHAREHASKLGVAISATNRRVVQDCPIVLLAVKPQMAEDVLIDVQTSAAHVCFISIMAGVKSSYIKSKLPDTAFVIPVMPNTPLLVGKAATVIAKSDDVPLDFYRAAVSIFSSSGDVVFLDEDYINAIIPLSSSSPAFFYRMAAVMLRFAEQMEVDSAVAIRLIAGAMEGSAAMLRESGKPPDELIAQVASPNGTTIAALNQLDIHGFDDALSAALVSCKERADQLSR